MPLHPDNIISVNAVVMGYGNGGIDLQGRIGGGWPGLSPRNMFEKGKINWDFIG